MQISSQNGITINTLAITDIGRFIRTEGITADQIAKVSFRDGKVDIYTTRGFDIDTKGQIMRPPSKGVDLLSVVRIKDGSIAFGTTDDKYGPAIIGALQYFLEIPDKNGRIAQDLYFVGFGWQSSQFLLTRQGELMKLNKDPQDGITHVRFVPGLDRFFAVRRVAHDVLVGSLTFEEFQQNQGRLGDTRIWESFWSDKNVVSISRPRIVGADVKLLVNFTDKIGRVLTFNPVNRNVSPQWGKPFPMHNIQLGYMLGTDMLVDYGFDDKEITFSVSDFTRQDHPIVEYLQ